MRFAIFFVDTLVIGCRFGLSGNAASLAVRVTARPCTCNRWSCHPFGLLYSPKSCSSLSGFMAVSKLDASPIV